MSDQKSHYVDGYVLVVAKNQLEAYKKMAEEAAEIWKKHGALDYKECVGEDLNPDMGEHKILTFPELVNLKEDEIVMFSYITYKSRQHRDEVNKNVMKEMDEKYTDDEHKNMPFELKRMSFGGFDVIVSS